MELKLRGGAGKGTEQKTRVRKAGARMKEGQGRRGGGNKRHEKVARQRQRSRTLVSSTDHHKRKQGRN